MKEITEEFMEDKEPKILNLRKSILEDNDADAVQLRRELKSEGTFYVNIMSSPGSGTAAKRARRRSWPVSSSTSTIS